MTRPRWGAPCAGAPQRSQHNGYVRLILPEPFLPYAAPEQFNTPSGSGKIQIEAPPLAEIGLDPLPCYIPPEQGGETGAGGRSGYPQMLLSPPEHQFLNSTFVNIPALRIVAGETKLLLLSWLVGSSAALHWPHRSRELQDRDR